MSLIPAILSSSPTQVRTLIAENRNCLSEITRATPETFHIPTECETDAYKFLGAYFGQISPLMVAIGKGEEGIGGDVCKAHCSNNKDASRRASEKEGQADSVIKTPGTYEAGIL